MQDSGYIFNPRGSEDRSDVRCEKVSHRGRSPASGRTDLLSAEMETGKAGGKGRHEGLTLPGTSWLLCLYGRGKDALLLLPRARMLTAPIHGAQDPPGQPSPQPAVHPKAAFLPQPGGDHPYFRVLQAVGDHSALGEAPSASPRAEEVDGQRAGCAEPAAGGGDCLQPAQGAAGGPWASRPLGSTAGVPAPALVGTQHSGLQ